MLVKSCILLPCFSLSRTFQSCLEFQTPWSSSLYSIWPLAFSSIFSYSFPHHSALGLLSVPRTYQIFCYIRTFEYHLPKISLTSLFQIEPLYLYTTAKCLLMNMIWGPISVLLHITYFVLKGEFQ